MRILFSNLGPSLLCSKAKKPVSDKTSHLVFYFTFIPNTILFLILFVFSLIIVTASTNDDHDLHNTKQEKDRHIAQLTRKLQSVTREKEDSQEIIITLQTELQEYKQQLLKTTG